VRKSSIIVGLFLMGVAIGWYLLLPPRLEVRFPAGWLYQAEVIGSNRYPEADGFFLEEAVFIEDDEFSQSTREVKVSGEDVGAGLVKIIDRYTTYDATTRTVTWELISEALVDPISGQYVGEFAGDYYFFPRNVQKTTYIVRNTSWEGLPVTFKGEEVINGMNTYHFVYEADTPIPNGYPDVVVADGQQIMALGLTLEYWVEPLTGEVIQYREVAPNDAIVNTATGEVITSIARWSGVTAPQNVVLQVDKVNAQIQLYQILTWIIPGVLGSIGIGCLLYGGFLTKRQRQTLWRNDLDLS
jgi:hypothetical protein